jgi:hypothetical protein
MPAAITWDQTLLSLVLSLCAAAIAYGLAARVLRKQEITRDLRRRRDALEQVLALLQGPAGEYLRDPEIDYPQRDMVELERRSLQAQLLFWRDLQLQEALRNIVYPDWHAEAAEKLRATAGEIDRELQGHGR